MRSDIFRLYNFNSKYSCEILKIICIDFQYSFIYREADQMIALSCTIYCCSRSNKKKEIKFLAQAKPSERSSSTVTILFEAHETALKVTLRKVTRFTIELWHCMYIGCCLINGAVACDFQQCGILTSANSDELYSRPLSLEPANDVHSVA